MVKTITLIHKRRIILEGDNIFDIEKQARQAAYAVKADEFEIDTYNKETDRKYPVVREYQS